MRLGSVKSSIKSSSCKLSADAELAIKVLTNRELRDWLCFVAPSSDAKSETDDPIEQA